MSHGKAFSLIIFLVLSTFAQADVKLPAIFSDHMVLQQNSSVLVWGWAEPGEKIEVKGCWQWFGGTKTKADEKGRWRVTIKTPKASDNAATLKIKGSNEIILSDILIGEVWICSGQSNMEMGMTAIDNADEEIAKADYPDIRLFHVGQAISTVPLQDVTGNWVKCSPETVASRGTWGGFSAAAYYFGRKLHKELHVPIGLISTNWGGTKAEAWTSRETIKDFDRFQKIMEMIDNPEKREANFKMHQNQPTALYNAMIAPLIPFRIAGVVWYQGESNRYDPILYRTLFPAMIKDWRQHWGQGDFPFYYIQIAPFQYKGRDPSQAIREAQMMTLDTVSNVGMAVTMDIGEEKDIHPHNKLDVGERLARWALAKTYGQKDLVYSGPIYKSMAVENGKIRVSFDYVDGGLTAKDGGLTDFEIAGADQKFVPAEAAIDGETILVSSDEVKDPVAVRYAWSNWVEGSLFNKAGLPASSFRTDNWPL